MKVIGTLGHADLLIVIGTALAVSPFNQCVNMVNENVPKVLINMDNTLPNFDFDSEEYPKRLLLKGKCDEIVWRICGDLGWSIELQAMIDKVCGN